MHWYAGMVLYQDVLSYYVEFVRDVFYLLFSLPYTLFKVNNYEYITDIQLFTDHLSIADDIAKRRAKFIHWASVSSNSEIEIEIEISLLSA